MESTCTCLEEKSLQRKTPGFPIYDEVCVVVFRPKCSIHFPSMYATCPAHHILLDLFTLIVMGEKYKL